VRSEEGEFAVESAAAKGVWVGEGARGGRLRAGGVREDVGGLTSRLLMSLVFGIVVSPHHHS
jgi:hypothetical protein